MEPRGSGDERRWRRLRQGIALGLCGAVGLLVFLTPLGAELRALLLDPNPERFQHWLAANASWMPLVLILAMIAHTLVPLPAELLAVAAGMMLGPVWGFCAIWLGAMLGAYLGFFLARVFGQAALQRLASTQRLQRLQPWVTRTDIPLLLAVRLVPVISFNLINFALGCTTVGWWRFTWTTAVGIIPVTAATVSFGAHLDNWPALLLLTLVAVLVALGGYAVIRMRSATSLRRVPP